MKHSVFLISFLIFNYSIFIKSKGKKHQTTKPLEHEIVEHNIKVKIEREAKRRGIFLTADQINTIYKKVAFSHL